jgi:hypothetical protein
MLIDRVDEGGSAEDEKTYKLRWKGERRKVKEGVPL